MPRVAVVIPCYNAEQYLSEAVESVLRQTYRDYEIVAVDNGCTDRTPEILRQYGDRVRIVHEPRRGLSQARNAGIAESGGELVAFLDADDFWEPGKLEAQVGLMDERPELGMVSTDYWMGAQTEGGCVRGKMISSTREDYLDAFFWGYPCHISTVLVRREALDDVGMFDERIAVCADSDLFLRMAETYPVGNCPIPLSTYRRHSQAMVTPHEDKLRRLVAEVDGIIADFCRRNPRHEVHERRRLAEIRLWAGRLLLTRDRPGAFRLCLEAFRTDRTSARALIGLGVSILPLPYSLLRELKHRAQNAFRH